MIREKKITIKKIRTKKGFRTKYIVIKILRMKFDIINT
jgi:hypothetical protein